LADRPHRSTRTLGFARARPPRRLSHCSIPPLSPCPRLPLRFALPSDQPPTNSGIYCFTPPAS
jgi:hypothetical protein